MSKPPIIFIDGLSRPPVPPVRPMNGPSLIRTLCDQILRGGPSQKDTVWALTESLVLYDDPDVLTAGRTASALQTVRQAVFETTLEDLNKAGAPLQVTDPKNRCRLAADYHTIQLLKPPADGAPYEELVIYATLCAALERYQEGRLSSQKALALQPDSAYLQASLAFLSDCASLPRFSIAFISRCHHAWHLVTDLLQMYGTGRLDAASLYGNVRKAFQLLTGLRVDVSLDNTLGNALMFSPLDWQCSYFLSSKAIALGNQMVPGAIREAWAADTAALSSAKVSDLVGNEILEARRIRTALEDTPDHRGVHVKLFHPAITPYASRAGMLEQLSAAVACALDTTADYCILIRSVELLSTRLPSFTGTLANLKDQLRALGYTTGHAPEEIEPVAMRRTYTRQPGEGTAPRLRDDITQGETLLIALQEEYERHETACADYFMNRGVAPVFLAWPRSIMDCGPAEFTQRLVEELGKEDGGDVGHNMKVLGQASGTQYCYLDLLLWSPTYILKAMEAYLARIPGGDAFRIQSFYWDAYPCPISFAYVVEHNALNIADYPLKNAKAAKSKSKRKGK